MLKKLPLESTKFTNKYLCDLQEVLGALDVDQIDAAIQAITDVWQRGGNIITFGNGGSAITAQHFITDWNKMIYMASGIPFRGRTLIDNMGLVSAYANDVSFEDIFSEQLKNIAMPGDLVLAISGSGNSENVLRGIKAANEIGCTSVGLVGFDGGKLKDMVDYPVCANVNDMQMSEDVHAIFGHIVMKKLCSL